MNARQIAALLLSTIAAVAAVAATIFGSDADLAQWCTLTALFALSIYDGERIRQLEKRAARRLDITIHGTGGAGGSRLNGDTDIGPRKGGAAL